MSGIVGIVNFNRVVVDEILLTRMTKFMAYRGPDAQSVVTEQSVGLGYAMLRTDDSQEDCQPCHLRQVVWIVADVRLDGRQELVRSLQLQGRADVQQASDAELILHAYYLWGEQCIDHLMGDFAFAIWDARCQQLFCARDQFGVKLFYYARSGDCLVFSNTLNCLRLHPSVSSTLNDEAIADFLLFDVNRDPNTTTFADIKRLPPAHTLICSESTHQIQRYWTLPTTGFIRHRRAEDYVEQFRELMTIAIHDRLKTDRVGVFMSGGLDSTTIAAIAQKVLAQSGQPYDLRAYTMICEQMIPDQEKTYAGLTAQALNLPIHYLVSDQYKLMEGWDQPKTRRPEPTGNLFPALLNDLLSRAAANSRVVLTGHGGDPVLLPSNSYALDLLKAGNVGSLITAIWHYFWATKHMPPLGIRTRLRQLMGKPPRSRQLPYPKWFNPAFASRLNLRDRWQQQPVRSSQAVHPTRNEAYQCLLSPTLTSIFENYDPGVTGYPLQIRYPYFDLRLVCYLLAIPPLPWCVHKHLVRQAMVGILPDVVRQRPKTPLAGDVAAMLMQHPSSQWLDQISYHTRLRDYVDPSLIPPISQPNREASWMNLRPLSLSNWLSYIELSESGGNPYAIG